MSGCGHQSFLSDWYSGKYSTSDAAGLAFQYNLATGGRCVAGVAVSLTRIEAAAKAWRGVTDGAPEHKAEMLRTWREEWIHALCVIHAVVYDWGDTPVLRSRDELVQPDDSS